MRGLQVGPDTICDPEPLPRALARVLMCSAMAIALGAATIALAGIEDGPDPGGVRGVHGAKSATAITEDPSPVTSGLPFVVIDMRPVAFTFNPLFINPEVPRAIVPKGWGVKIIMPYIPEPDSGCNGPQTKQCTSACSKQGKSLSSCELDVQWNADGTTTRYLVCTCYSKGAGLPEVAGSSVPTTEVRLADRQ